MQIYEFLKVKKVKCVDVDGMCLTKDKEYQLLGVTDRSCMINDDDGYETWASMQRFEPVLDNNIVKDKLDELLKASKVRCVTSYDERLTVGKEYAVVGTDVEIQVKDDNEGFSYWGSDCFEPVLDKDVSKSNTEIDTSLNSVNAVNKVIPTFKVGDKVYKHGETDVKTVLEVFEDGYMSISNYPHWVNYEAICHATQENYELLCKLYPHIKFELPPKKITGSDLCRAMLDKGWHLVPCVVSHISDSEALNNDNCCLVDEWYASSFDSCFNSGDDSYKYAVPFDPKTGIPLTEDVLNETIN